jgi:hypothetical protein
MKQAYLFLAMLLSITIFAQIDEQGFEGTRQFGNSVAVDGDWAVVGNEHQNGMRVGITYHSVGMISIYKKLPNGNWELFQNIQEADYYANPNWPNSQMSNLFGKSVDIVSIDDNHIDIIVGAPYYDSDLESNIGPDGMAFIYSLNNNGDSFVKVATIAPEIEVHNSFGSSVAISNGWAVIGDPTERHPMAGANEDSWNIGCAYVYQKVANQWQQHTKLAASDGWGSIGSYHGDQFGYAVDIDNNQVIIGAPLKGIQNGVQEGAVYLYDLNGGIWNETIFDGMMVMVDEHARFGDALAIKDDYFIVGAPAAAGSVVEGSAFLYHKNGGVWDVDAGPVLASDGANGNVFGGTVSLSSDRLIIGAYAANSHGKAYLYDYTATMTESMIESSDIDLSDQFAYACGISEDDLLIGANYKSNNPGNAHYDGKVYFYSMALAFGGNWVGNISADWGDPGNWADNHVPNGATDVIINAAAPHQPFISNMVGFCKDLTINEGATLKIANINSIEINGDLVHTGDIIILGKSDANVNVIVMGTTLFNGPERQDIPSGIYQEFTFDAGADSYLLGDVTFNGNYIHSSNDDLIVGNNTLTVGGFLWGNDRNLKFSPESSLTIINDRVIDLNLASNIYDLYDFTIDVPSNHGVALGGGIEVHNQLNLLDGDLYLGQGASIGRLELHQPITIVDGQLLPHKNGGNSELYILEDSKNKDVFRVPASLSTLSMFFIERIGSTVLDGDLHIDDIFLLSTAGFSANGHQITYGDDGELWIGGDADVSEDMVTGPNGIQELAISSGSPTLSFSGEIQGDLSIGANVGQVEIAVGHCITVGGSTNINSDLILRSDANGTACFIDNGPIVYGAKGDASIIVERYIPSKEKWHYISTPVKNSTAEFFAGTYLNAYDTDNSEWVPFTSLNQVVNTMEGYSTKLPAGFSGQTITFSGELNTAHSAPLSISLTDGGNGYNLVGNPFPSVIDWDDANWTKNNIANAVYTWNAGTGSYATYIGGASVNGGSRYIAPMQGFFVEATGANPSLQIDNNDIRLDHEASFLKEEEDLMNQLSISLSGSVGTDEIIIRFIEEATAEFDANYDAHKMFGNANLAQVYAIADDLEQMAIHSLSDVKNTEFIKLGLKIEESGNYVMNFNDFNSFNENVTITLEDTKMNTFKVLSASDSYEFNFEVGENTNRFVLHFKDITAINELDDSQVFAYVVGHTLYLNIDEQADIDAIQIYSINGQLVKEVNMQNGSLIGIDMQGLSKATYLVKMISKSNTQTQKFIYQ